MGCSQSSQTAVVASLKPSEYDDAEVPDRYNSTARDNTAIIDHDYTETLSKSVPVAKPAFADSASG